MTKLIYTKSFLKSYKKFCKNNIQLKSKIDKTLVFLSEDYNHLLINSHKLQGNLYGLYACSCGYDCRIVFKIVKEEITNYDVILLIDIGTHKEVY